VAGSNEQGNKKGTNLRLKGTNLFPLSKMSCICGYTSVKPNTVRRHQKICKAHALSLNGTLNDITSLKVKSSRGEGQVSTRPTGNKGSSNRAVD
jgi:hypothetical protein